jgi:transposase
MQRPCWTERRRESEPSGDTKTNRIDARVLLQMSEVINQHPEREKYIRPLPDAQRQILAAMVVRRRQLTVMLTAERNRLHPSHPQSYESIRSIISALKSELARIQGEMSIHINSHFSELSDLLSTEVGSVHPFGQNVCL